MHGVIDPECRCCRLEPFARGVRLYQPQPPSQRQPEQRHRGQWFERVADGAGEDRVFFNPFQITLVKHPLPGLAQRLNSHALPDRREPENRFQTIRLADLPDAAGGRPQRYVGPADAHCMGDPGVNP